MFVPPPRPEGNAGVIALARLVGSRVATTAKSYWLLGALMGLLAAGYWWMNQVPWSASTADASVFGAAFKENQPVPGPGVGQRKVVLENLGMRCPLCRGAVAAHLSRLGGVVAYDVDLKTDSATVLYEASRLTPEELERAVAQAGFRAKSLREVQLGD